MLPHLLTNYEIQKYYQKKPIFSGVYSRNKLSIIKDGTNVINLDEYKSIGICWIALYVNGDNVGASNIAKYFDSFPAGTRRPKDVPRWSYFGRDVPDHNRTKIGHIRFLT